MKNGNKNTFVFVVVVAAVTITSVVDAFISGSIATASVVNGVAGILGMLAMKHNKS